MITLWIIAVFAFYLNLHWWWSNRQARRRQQVTTEADYRLVMARIRELMECDPPVGSRAVDELHLLAAKIETYEAEHHPMRD